MDFRQSEPFKKYLVAGGWKIYHLDKSNSLYSYKLALLGEAFRLPHPRLPIDLAAILAIVKKNDGFLVKIEPKFLDEQIVKDLKLFKFQKDNWSIEPTKSLVIDLSKSQSDLFLDLKPKWRQYVRFAKKNGVKLVRSKNINLFSSLRVSNAKLKGYFIESRYQLKTLFKELKKLNKVELIFATVQNKVVAGAFVIYWENKAHLWSLAFGGEYKELRPLHFLVWEAIILSKRKGMKMFDFEGIEDERFPYSKKIQPTFFKKGFGGKDEQYLGSYIHFLNPLIRNLYKIVTFLDPGLLRIFIKSRP